MLEHLSLIVHLSPNNMVKLSLLVTLIIKPLTLLSLSLSLITDPQSNKVCFMGLFPPSPLPPIELRDNNGTPVQPVTVILILLEQCRNNYAVFNCYCD